MATLPSKTAKRKQTQNKQETVKTSTPRDTAKKVIPRTTTITRTKTAHPAKLHRLSTQITDEKMYINAMSKIDTLMNKGSSNLTQEEKQEIRSLAIQAQAYEQSVFTIRPPQSLAGILEMKMYEMRIKQKALAQILNVSDAKLSLIISGKQKPDIDLLKKIHFELQVDARLLLTVA